MEKLKFIEITSDSVIEFDSDKVYLSLEQIIAFLIRLVLYSYF